MHLCFCCTVDVVEKHLKKLISLKCSNPFKRVLVEEAYERLHFFSFKVSLVTLAIRIRLLLFVLNKK